MREILFRGTRKDNGEWVYGYYEFYNGGHYINVQTDRVNSGGYPIREFIEVIPETVGQYTGFTDKNGKKIFEGDIIDASKEWWDAGGPAGHHSPIIEVKWDEDFCGFDPFANYDCDCGVYISALGCVIIGNIHDNPELLKGE